MKTSKALWCRSSVLAILIATGGASAALAQDPARSPAEAEAVEDNVVEEVVVTGSRVATGAVAPTPVTAVTPETINQVELPNIADAITQLPALRSSQSAGRGGAGTNIGAALNLRSLGVNRTLVLVDGKRFVGTPQFGGSSSFATNIDSIPQALIRRIDTVTGGASAAYGSDAVAGVVNFVLDEDFEGFKAEASYGQTSRDDGRKYEIELTGGGAFADGRGHVLANFNYARSEGIKNDIIGNDPARPWQNEASTLGRETVTVNGVTGIRLVKGARQVLAPRNGLILGCVTTTQLTTNCPLYGTTFNDIGTVSRPYDFGVRNAANSVFAVGGEGHLAGGQALLDTPSIRNSMYGRVGYDITPTLSAYIDVIASRTRTHSEAYTGTFALLTGSPLGLSLGLDYLYLPPELRAQMVANGVSTINIQKQLNTNVQQLLEGRTNRVVVGLQNRFNDRWTGDLYYTYGEVSSTMTVMGVTNTIAFRNATQTIRDPANPSNIICADATARANGCVPWNVFGQEALSPALDAYLNPATTYTTFNSQQVIEGTISGGLLALPAGTLDVALGAGYRKESLDRSTDSLGLAGQRNPFNNNPGALMFLNNPAVQGELELWEVFGEAQVPLIRDRPFFDTFELNLAARYTDYSTSGGVTTWKAGLIYVPVEGIRFRAAMSRDIRAANIVELFSPLSTSFASVRDPLRNNQSIQIVPISSGNPDLVPEEADTLTVGVVLRPPFIPGLTASIDYYSIEMSGQISTLASQRTLDLCTAGDADYCALIQRNPTTGDLISIRTPFLNLADAKAAGVDIEVGYNTSLQRFGLPGDFNTQLFATYVIENSTKTAGAAAIDIAPQSGRLQGLLTMQYTTGPWTFSLQEHYMSGGLFNVQERYLGDSAHSQLWTDIAIRRTFGEWQVFGTVLNIFDEDPPVYPHTGPSSSAGSDPLFDRQGRRYMVGVRVKK